MHTRAPSCTLFLRNSNRWFYVLFAGMLKFKEYDDRRQCGSDARVLNQLVKYQIILLSHALTKFPRVRRVVYSTCSVFSEENEYVIREVLKKIKHFKLVDSGKIFNGWQNYVSLDSKSNETLAVRSVPNLDCSDGFFMAALEKVSVIMLFLEQSNTTEEVDFILVCVLFFREICMVERLSRS